MQPAFQRKSLLSELRHPLGFLINGRAPSPAVPNSRCMACDSDKVDLYPIKTAADFDTSVLPAELRQAFDRRAAGYCLACGLGQEFHRLSSQQIREWISVLSSKDMAVSEEAFHTFPVPVDYIEAFNRSYFSKRLDAWRTALTSMQAPKKVLFLRPMWGAAPRFFIEQFGSQCLALEISDVCRRTISAELPQIKWLEGNIHADFFGPFLESGLYDAVVCFHTVVHCLSAPTALRQIRSLLKPDGFALFTHEVNVKPHNPFHMLFANEPQFVSLLQAEFSKIVRIDDCEDNVAPHVANFTVDGKNPDFIAFA